MTEPFPTRPRYMHRRTYQCLRRQYEAAVELYVEGFISMGVPLVPRGAATTSRE